MPSNWSNWCLRSVAWLLLVAGMVDCLPYEGSSPFLVLSVDSMINRVSPGAEESVGLAAEEAIESAVQSCSYDAYVFVDQPEVSQRHINEDTMPFLSKLFAKSADKMAFQVLSSSPKTARMAGDEALDYAINHCGSKLVEIDASSGQFASYVDTQSRVLTLKFGNAQSDDELTANDAILKSVFGRLPSRNVLVAYRTTPTKPVKVAAAKPAKATSIESGHGPVSDDASLFAKYQFLSPGLYMTIAVSLLLGGILVIAMQWLSALQVSYKSFTKQTISTEKQG